MNSHPRIKRHCAIVGHSADYVEFRSGVWQSYSTVINDDGQQGKLLQLVTYLDGTRPLDELARLMDMPESEIAGIVKHLHGSGVLEEQTNNVVDHYLDTCVPTLGKFALNREAPRAIAIMGHPRLAERLHSSLASALVDCQLDDPASLVESLNTLRRAGSTCLQDGLALQRLILQFASWKDRLVVTIAEWMDPLALQVLNRLSLAIGFPWIHATLDGPCALVGPTFLPKRSACFECLETRVLMNMQVQSGYVEYRNALAAGRVTGTKGRVLEPVGDLLVGHTALEVTNFMLTGANFTVGKMLSIHIPTMDFTFNDVLRVPGCPACAPLPPRDEGELYFAMRSLIAGNQEA